MFSFITHSGMLRASTLLTGLGMVAISGSQSAQALHIVSVSPTYFNFDTSGGILNPGIIVGFNPQPDPPVGGKPQVSIIGNDAIRLSQADGSDFNFVLSFTGLPGLLLPAVQKPDSDGITDFGFEYGGNQFNVGLSFSGPGPAGSWTWGAFNPQPDPPGAPIGYNISFAGVDPTVTIRLQENSVNLSISAPEPSTWAMMIVGFAGLGFAGYRRNKAAAIAA